MSMKRFILLLLNVLAISLAGFSQEKNFIDQPYIEVAGSADTLVTPNQVFIRIVISEKDSRDRVPIQDSEVRMVEALKALGINTEAELTTSDIISNFRFYLLRQKDIIKSKEYMLKVPDASMASKVFIQLENLGISNVSIDRVDHDGLESIRNLCREKAIENARVKAIALTRSIGQTIGNAIHITDNEANFDNLLHGKLAGLDIRGFANNDKQKNELPKIEFEKIKIRTAVSAKFVLK
jgi:uncharacterized protein YggE